MIIRVIMTRLYIFHFTLIVGGLLLLSPKQAQAQNVGTVMDSVTFNMGWIPALFSSISYLTGIGFTIMGLIKMRDYVDNQSQNHMKDALARLGIGAALIALPFAINVAIDTIGGDANAAIVNRPALYN